VLVLEKLLGLARGLGDAAAAAHLARLIAALEPGHPAAALLRQQRQQARHAQGQGQGQWQATRAWPALQEQRPSSGSSSQSSQEAYRGGVGEAAGEEEAEEAVWGPRIKRLKTEQEQQRQAEQVGREGGRGCLGAGCTQGCPLQLHAGLAWAAPGC
jgi:hypothetical protein